MLEKGKDHFIIRKLLFYGIRKQYVNIQYVYQQNIAKDRSSTSSMCTKHCNKQVINIQYVVGIVMSLHLMNIV